MNSSIAAHFLEDPTGRGYNYTDKDQTLRTGEAQHGADIQHEIEDHRDGED